MQEHKSEIRVLLIDDNLDDVELTKRMLSKIKDIAFNVEHCERIKTALERLKEFEFDIILCDLNLPDSRGMDTFLRVHDQAKDTAIVILTGTNLEATQALNAIKNGAQDFLKKDELTPHLLTHSICYSLERQTVAEQIKQLAKSKEGFVAMVSHELRNPLSTINLSVKLLLDRLGGTISEVDRELFSVADRSIDRMIRLTNDVLDFEALESGKITFATQRNDMAEVLSEVHKVMLPAARKKGVGLSVNAEQNLPPVNFDRDRIFQVLLNLVGNAIKCTEKGSVTMTAKTEDGGMHIAVQDTGSGMSPEEMPKLFHNFGQLKNCPAGGTGLGLAISKDIIELHGGRIWAESEKGKGSIFHFILPLLHIDYPLADETVKRGRYTIRISGGTEECHVAIDDGGWQSCRSADGYSWYDWCPTETRAHRISARTRIGNKLVETEKTCSVV